MLQWCLYQAAVKPSLSWIELISDSYLYTHWKLKLHQWVNSCRTAGAWNRGKPTELCSFFEDLHSTHLCWSTLWWRQIWWACTDTKAEIGLVFGTLISTLLYEIENDPLLSAVLLQKRYQRKRKDPLMNKKSSGSFKYTWGIGFCYCCCFSRKSYTWCCKAVMSCY